MLAGNQLRMKVIAAIFESAGGTSNATNRNPSSECKAHQRPVNEMMRVPLALFGHCENVLSKHGPSAVGSAIQVFGLYSSPSFVQRVTEDMKCFLVKFLSLSNKSHFTLCDRVA